MLADFQTYGVGPNTTNGFGAFVLETIFHNVDGALVELRVVFQVPPVVEGVFGWQRDFYRWTSRDGVFSLYPKKVPYLRPDESLRKGRLKGALKLR